MNRLQMGLSKIVQVLFCLMAWFILGSALILDRRNDWFTYQLLLPDWVLLLVWLGIGAVLWTLWKKKGKKAEIFGFAENLTLGREKALGLVSTLILLALQLILVKCIYFPMGWDVTYMREAAQEYLSGGLSDFYTIYLQVNPNNIGIYAVNILFTILGNLLGISGNALLILTGILLTDLSLLLAAACSKKLTGHKAAGVRTWILLALLIGLSPWIMVPYTDLLTICIPIGSLALALRMEESSLPTPVRGSLVALLPILGTLLKPTCAIIYIAMAIVFLLYFSGKAEVKKLAGYACGAALVLLALLLCKAGIRRAVDYQADESREKTALHYMLLGSNTQTGGYYNLTDDEYTTSFPGKAEKNQADWAKIRERYSQMSPAEFIYHFAKKSDLNFNNGTFGWGKEDNTLTGALTKSDSRLGRFLQGLYYPNNDRVKEINRFGVGGEWFDLWALLEQFLWVGILLIFAIGGTAVLLGRGVFEKKTDLLLLTCMGLALFLSLFETNARYLINYLPVIAVTAEVLRSRIGKGSK